MKMKVDPKPNFKRYASRNLVELHHYDECLLPIHQEINTRVDWLIILHFCVNYSDHVELFTGNRVDRHHIER
jgi:hypothetical protein